MLAQDRIGGVVEPELLQAGTGLLHGLLPDRGERQKALQHHGIQLLSRQLRGEGFCEQAGSTAGDGDGKAFQAVIGKQGLLAETT